MYHYFVFDMDGTLVDTTEGIISALQLMQEQMPLEKLPESVLRNFIGPPLKESFMKYYGVSLEQTEEMTRVYRDCYGKVGIGKTQIFDITLQMLEEIRAAGGKTAVATLKQHQLATQTLRYTGIDRLVDHIELNLDNSVGNKAEMIRHALSILGCKEPSQAIMVGDSPYDGHAAQDAGVAFLPLVCSEGFRDITKLNDIPHVAAAHTTREMLDLIRQMI